ncbi:hypothetical protein [Streptacidiphilus sp. P02-A3a]|uniref:hypothetical protein n=1 Tax=Streptacidiphilus sp. P02-A3a TaxID=2704468 RepID=UPI0015FC81B8|nr:hypothetical protein [Streptacidiphilus sp. P02-A3a]QMU69684.1 hypothetical protein GXP74_16995 [Streptacidiphilus sp. P02-A3a]
MALTFCHVYGRAKTASQPIPGWPYSFVAVLVPRGPPVLIFRRGVTRGFARERPFDARDEADSNDKVERLIRNCDLS